MKVVPVGVWSRLTPKAASFLFYTCSSPRPRTHPLPAPKKPRQRTSSFSHLLAEGASWALAWSQGRAGELGGVVNQLVWSRSEALVWRNLG